jgi:hypothetical protein
MATRAGSSIHRALRTAATLRATSSTGAMAVTVTLPNWAVTTWRDTTSGAAEPPVAVKIWLLSPPPSPSGSVPPGRGSVWGLALPGPSTPPWPGAGAVRPDTPPLQAMPSVAPFVAGSSVTKTE